jgi:hypothetical protein
MKTAVLWGSPGLTREIGRKAEHLLSFVRSFLNLACFGGEPRLGRPPSLRRWSRVEWLGPACARQSDFDGRGAPADSNRIPVDISTLVEHQQASWSERPPQRFLESGDIVNLAEP